VKSIGAVGLILKGDDPADLPDRIRAVAAGGTVWSRSIAV
jgi:DNA-binding NarL/FixJ family response regulator